MKNSKIFLLSFLVLFSSCTPYITDFLPAKDPDSKLNYPLTVLIKQKKIEVVGVFPGDKSLQTSKIKYKIINSNSTDDGIPHSLYTDRPDGKTLEQIRAEYSPYLQVAGLKFPKPKPPICDPGMAPFWEPIIITAEIIPTPDLDRSLIPTGNFRSTSAGPFGSIHYTEYNITDSIITIRRGWIETGN
ncbi:MAG: hypothetical protein R8P61_16435 [Bacteroidia bacterium]|nr:hypothetical protein [Bacteroidia bacterium]